MESRQIVEASGQVIFVHKGWTASKKSDILKPGNTSARRQDRRTGTHDKPVTARPFSQDTNPSAKGHRSTPNTGYKMSEAGQKFEFVHSSGPYRTGDVDVSKLIRVHAMRDSARKKKRQKESEEAISLGQDSPVLTEQLQRFLQESIAGEVKRSYQVVPFARDPSPSLSAVVHDLINVSSRMYPMEGAFKFNPLSPAHWFHFAQADQALYHTLQYTSAAYESLSDGKNQSQRAAFEMSQCIYLLNERLQGNDDIADGTIAATSCLALVEALKGNHESWKVHMNGLKQMVKMRGGIAALTNPVLRLKLFRADMVGSIDLCAFPHFLFVRSSKQTLYELIVGPHGPNEDDKLWRTLTRYGLQDHIIDALMKTRHFSEAINVALGQRSLAIDPVVFVEDTFEIQYQFILFSPTPSTDFAQQCLGEALRMGGLLYIKETLREYPLAVLGTMNIAQRLKDALADIWRNDSFAPVLLWLGFMGAVSLKGADRAWFMAQLITLGMKLGLRKWTDVKDVLESVLLIERLHGESCKEIWEEVEMMRNVLCKV